MKSNCNKCTHKEMCKYRDNINTEDMLAKIQAEYPFVADLDFSCKFFEKKEKVVKEVSAPVAEPVKEAKAEKPVADKKEVSEKQEEPKAESKSDTANSGEVSSFEDIRVVDFGLSDDTTSELVRIGGKEIRIRDLKGYASRMSPKCKNEVNGRLSAFHRSL